MQVVQDPHPRGKIHIVRSNVKPPSPLGLYFPAEVKHKEKGRREITLEEGFCIGLLAWRLFFWFTENQA